MAIAPSFDDLLSVGQAEAQARRSDLGFNDGDVTEAQLHGAAAMADLVIRYGAQGFRETFIDGASGDALATLINDRLGIQRKAAVQSQANIIFYRSSHAAGGGTIPAGTQVATDFDPSGVQVVFTTDADVIVGATDFSAGPVNVTAVIAGRAGNVTQVNKIDKILSNLFDPTFTISDSSVAGGGEDQQSDEDLRATARAFWSTIRRGTLAALEYGAKLVPSVANARAIEDQYTGVVTIRVSDSAGNSTLQMVSDVQAELENWRAAGIRVTVLGDAPAVLDMAIAVKARDGFDVDAVADLFVAAATTRIDRSRSSQTVYLDQIRGAIVGVAPDDVEQVTFLSFSLSTDGSPRDLTKDITPPDGRIIRHGTITVQAA